MPDTEATTDAITESIDTGPALADNQSNEPSATEAAAAEPTEANRAEATDASSSTSETRSDVPPRGESAQDLLNRVVPGVSAATKPATAVTTGNPGSDPFAHLSPALQNLLKDPQQAKRLENLDSLYGRQAQEVGQLRQMTQAYQGLPPPDQMRSLIEQQRQHAEIAKMKPWVSGHPEAQQAQGRIQRARMYKQAFEAGVPEEALGKLAKDWRVSADDVKLLNEYDEHKQTIQDRLATDFDGLFNDYFQSRFGAAIQQWENVSRARIGASQFLEQNQDLLNRHVDTAMWAMTNENRREVALKLAQQEEELSKLRGSAVKDAETVSAAQARTAVTKTRASAATKRDPVTNAGTIENVVQRSRKMGDKEYLEALMKARSGE